MPCVALNAKPKRQCERESPCRGRDAPLCVLGKMKAVERSRAASTASSDAQPDAIQRWRPRFAVRATSNSTIARSVNDRQRKTAQSKTEPCGHAEFRREAELSTELCEQRAEAESIRWLLTSSLCQLVVGRRHTTQLASQNLTPLILNVGADVLVPLDRTACSRID